jgi:hypothetical protein
VNKFGTNSQVFPLSTGSNSKPTLVQGSPTSFLLNTLPDRAPGGLAYYINCVYLTFEATLTQVGTYGSMIHWDKLPGIFMESVEWINCWHGTPLSANYNKGLHMNIIEFLKGGFRYAWRKMEPIPAAAGANTVRWTIALYPSCSNAGDLLHNTSQLAKLFQNSSININVANAAALASFSTGATLTDITCRASVDMSPRNEIVLGTPIETVLHSIAAGSSSSDQIQIRGFGTDSQLQGVQRKGGVLSLLELSSQNNQGGALQDVFDVTQFNFPWRNQVQTYDIRAYLSSAFQMQLPAAKVQTFPTNVVGGDSEAASFPYPAFHSNATYTADVHELLAFPLVTFGEQVRLSDAQTADSDKDYYLTANFTSPGNHLILAEYAKAWQEESLKSFTQLVTAGGSSSLAAHVLGSVDRVNSAELKQRLPLTKRVVTTDNLAYLPWQLTPKA